MIEAQLPKRTQIACILGVRILASKFDPSEAYTILIKDGRIDDVSLFSPKEPIPAKLPKDTLDARGCLVTSSLCHPHVHLDKAFLMSDPKYADLTLKKGDFAEAMELGKKAKERFTHEDLVRRGKWLIAESMAAGVTHMRAFVEIDTTVEYKCLEAAIELKNYFAKYCHIQICAFAQDALISGSNHEQNLRLFDDAVRHPEVEAIGTTPYVENEQINDAKQKNMDYAEKKAIEVGKHLDFHLDYNLDQTQQPSINNFLNTTKWSKKHTPNSCITLGHCTRLTLFTHSEWQSLAHTIQAKDLPISFIGLPTSDLFIQGKPSPPSPTATPGDRPRGTLQIPQMIHNYNLNGAIGINNVGNAFTPHGSCDPLQLASWGMGLYHAGTERDVETLFGCVSGRAKAAIGVDEGRGEDAWNRGIEVGARADLVIFGNRNREGDTVPLSRQRPRLGLMDLVCDPPKERMVIFGGYLVEM